MAAVAAGYRKGLVSAGWAIFCFLAQTSIGNGPLPCRDSISGFLGSFQVWRFVLWLEAPGYYSFANEWVKVMNLQRTSEGSCG